jgi:hypothetical protein
LLCQYSTIKKNDRWNLNCIFNLLLSFLEIKWISLIEWKTSFILRWVKFLCLFYSECFWFSGSNILILFIWLLDPKLTVEFLIIFVLKWRSFKYYVFIFKKHILFLFFRIHRFDCQAIVIFAWVRFVCINSKRIWFLVLVYICKFVSNEFAFNSQSGFKLLLSSSMSQIILEKSSVNWYSCK